MYSLCNRLSVSAFLFIRVLPGYFIFKRTFFFVFLRDK